MNAFTTRAWAETAALRDAILDLPFNRELAAGTLSQERFQFYMIQDALYLEQYSRALSIAAAKAPDPEAMQRFAHAAEEALVVERALHGGFFEKFGIDPNEAAAAEPSPTCYGYTNFLLSAAHIGAYEELVAAILPCFWIYWDVGNHIAKESVADNPYQAWIDTYSDPGLAKRWKLSWLSPTGQRQRIRKNAGKQCSALSSDRRSMNGCFGTALIAWKGGRSTFE